MNVIDLFSKKTSKYSATLADIPCSELQNEIDRRKEENYQKKVQEANAKADKIEYLITQIQSELSVPDNDESLINLIATHIVEDSMLYSYSYRYHRGDDIYDSSKNRIEVILQNILSSQGALPNLLLIFKRNIRKNLISSIHKEC